MQNSNIKRFFRKLRTVAARRPQRVVVTAMGSQKVFHAYDLGADTIVFERDVWEVMDEHASVLVAEKNDLAPGSFGHLLTVTSGNHSVAAHHKQALFQQMHSSNWSCLISKRIPASSAF